MNTTKTIMCTRVLSLFHLLPLIIITCDKIPTGSCALTQRHFAIDFPSLNRSLKFKCEKPQQRSYNLVDLMIYQGYSVRDERPYQPSYVVVHRCDGHAGCCNYENKICMPDKKTIYYEELEFEFLVLDSYKQSVTKRKTISIEQHRKCKCSYAGHAAREDLEKNRPTITLV